MITNAAITNIANNINPNVKLVVKRFPHCGHVAAFFATDIWQTGHFFVRINTVCRSSRGWSRRNHIEHEKGGDVNSLMKMLDHISASNAEVSATMKRIAAHLLSTDELDKGIADATHDELAAKQLHDAATAAIAVLYDTSLSVKAVSDALAVRVQQRRDNRG